MVVGVFPVFKLGVLFVKQISKPLANFLVTHAKNHPVFRTYVIIPPAQFYHWAEVKAKMYIMNLGKPTKVAKLNETMAIELGANLLGEIIIFSLAGGCLMFEYNRQTSKEAKKEEARLANLQEIQDNIQTLQNQYLTQAAEIRYLVSSLQELAKISNYKLPPYPIEKDQAEASSSSNSTTQSDTADSDKTSVVHRAINYYKNDVKGDKIS
ncbi:optic atrophy 3 protein homolog [Prorops nasuta]|uniref:optic atrophy 3 protein homolog n=1 Tax=Prorops nasuta TaxID=863751 RepID=UPI0034CD4909